MTCHIRIDSLNNNESHRPLLWRSEAALEEGRAADGQLLLRGHAGVMPPAPTDAALCGASAQGGDAGAGAGAADARLIAVFGRGLDGKQARWAMLATCHMTRHDMT